MHGGNTISQFSQSLDQVGHVHGHGVDRSIVVLLNVAQHAPVLLRHEIDGHTFATETSTTSDSAKIYSTNYYKRVDWNKINDPYLWM